MAYSFLNEHCLWSQKIIFYIFSHLCVYQSLNDNHQVGIYIYIYEYIYNYTERIKF
jgi:hypothetical protein